MDRPGTVAELKSILSELDQYKIEPQQLLQLEEELKKENGKGRLQRKIHEIRVLRELFEQYQADRYITGEKLPRILSQKAPLDPTLKGTEFFLDGYTGFTPAQLEVITAILPIASVITVTVTIDPDEPELRYSDPIHSLAVSKPRPYELFALSKQTISALIRAAEQAHVPVQAPVVLDGKQGRQKEGSELAWLESHLFRSGRRGMQPYPAPAPGTNPAQRQIFLRQCADPYDEVLSAAVTVEELIRSGYRYRDIAIICNDQETAAPIVKRVFEEYGIDLFLDTRRSVLSSNAAVFVVSFLSVLENRWRSQDVFAALKTGLTPLEAGDIEQLELYVQKYHVRGSMWKKPFTKGESEYGPEGMDRLNGFREQAAACFGGLEEVYRRKDQNYRCFVTALWRYMTEELKIPERITEMTEALDREGFPEEADEASQVWNMIGGQLDQVVELIGDTAFDGAEFLELLTAGLQNAEVGVLPSTVDDIMMGTMQRTRTGDRKALLVIGANDGVLPEKPRDDGLLGMDELEELQAAGHEICKTDSVRVSEERLAIYRNLSRPSEELWISWSQSDTEGKEMRRSGLVEDILGIFPDLSPERDVLNREDGMELVGGRASTLRHLTEGMSRAVRRGEKMDPIWKPVRDWYREHEPDRVRMLDEGLRFENRVPRLSGELTDLLFNRSRQERSLSASRLEKFALCPFSYFVRYGLVPEEERSFEAAKREIGDVYHHCIMNVTRKLSREHRWENVTEEECREIVTDAIDRESESYRDGLFRSGGREKYRAERMRDVCYETVLTLVRHARAGKISDSGYEVRFGRAAELAPIVVEVNGITIYIEGQIDRIDLLENGRVKIIDYKSGDRELKDAEVRAGRSLQLMLYMSAAREDGRRKPAGVFYFHIQEPRAKMDKASGRVPLPEEPVDPVPADPFLAEVEKEIRKQFRLKGRMVDDPETVEEIAGEFQKTSDVVNLTRSRDGGLRGDVMTEAEFEELEQAAAEKVVSLCADLAGGRIDIRPMKEGDWTACQYCDYQSVCRFDRSFRGCRYEEIEE
ncbi:MAG TPA: hypothetical protein DCS59_04695 [Eubacterium sp.]|nr:hypothetical protein [Eubacterium sp.]